MFNLCFFWLSKFLELLHSNNILNRIHDILPIIYTNEYDKSLKKMFMSLKLNVIMRILPNLINTHFRFIKVLSNYYYNLKINTILYTSEFSSMYHQIQCAYIQKRYF